MNRKCTLVIFFLLGIALTAAWSQPAKGSYLIDGSLNHQLSFTGGETSFTLFWSPEAARYLSDRLAVGAGLDFGLFAENGAATFLGLRPLVRYHLSRPGASKQWFVEGQGGFFRSLGDGGEGQAFARLSGGLALFCSPDVALEPTLNLVHNWRDGDGLGFDLNLGARFRAYLHSREGRNGDLVSPIRRGAWFVGGSAGELGFGGDFQIFSFSLQPNAGYFITDRLAIGAALSFGYVHQEEVDGRSLGLLPQVRYYLPATGRAHWFLALRGGLSTSRSRFSRSGIDSLEFTADGLTLSAGPGVNYFIGPRVALEAQLNYNFLRVRAASGFDETTEQQSALGLNLGIQVFLGGKE